MQDIKNIKVTSIEKKVDILTPDFVVNTTKYVSKFRNYSNWQMHVKFYNGKTIRKNVLIDGVYVERSFDSACPDFILQTPKQMESLNDTIVSANNGIKYTNPFSRNSGWYIEVFGSFWHSEYVIGLPIEEHIEEVKDAYESNGNHILILLEDDIINRWEEVCQPQINKFINDFLMINNCYKSYLKKEEKYLSQQVINCLNDSREYKILNDLNKTKVVDELIDIYQNIEFPYPDKHFAFCDLQKFKNHSVGEKLQRTRFGQSFLDYFIRSRFDANCFGEKSLKEIWKNKELMRKSIVWQFENTKRNNHAKRFLDSMTHRTGFRTITNMSPSTVYVRMYGFKKTNGIFFDPCAGWGGRLLGAWALGMKYIAIDANKKLVEELKDVANYIGADVEIYYGDSSDSDFVKRVLRGRKIDIAFTSPPYFKKEEYSLDKYQSILMYDDKERWEKCFLFFMCKNVMDNLSSTGKFLLSIDESVNLSIVSNSYSIKKHYFLIDENSKDDPIYMISNDIGMDGIDYVVCKECGEHLLRLGRHLRSAHNITPKEYLFRHPDELLICQKDSERVSNENKNKIKKGTYNKRTVYLLPNGRYAGKVDAYKRAWNTVKVDSKHVIDASTVVTDEYVDKVEGVDYVTCNECGVKQKNLKLHLRKKHNIDVKDYKGQVVCSLLKEKYHNAALQKWKTQLKKKL